ncbi:MAG: hypothetical protein K6E47_00135 [Lachnospiraceae bacterium]|nr:hypothetical protein [Lachnospiraceae bacterium]
MDELTELIEDLSKIISIQTAALERLSSKLAEYISLEEIEKLYDDTETKKIMEKWDT